jgi:hypothetical protein
MLDEQCRGVFGGLACIGIIGCIIGCIVVWCVVRWRIVLLYFC